VIIRDATGEDVAKVVELWREFAAEVPDRAWRDTKPTFTCASSNARSGPT